MRKKLTLRGKVSLTLFVSVSCVATALVAVLLYSALSMEFFRMGMESIHEAQLQVAIHERAAAPGDTATEAEAGGMTMNRIRVTAQAERLPARLRRLLAEGHGAPGYRTVIIDHDGAVDGIYCFLALPLDGRTWYAWQRVSHQEAEAYIRPQFFSRIHTVLFVGAGLLALLLLFLFYIFRRIRRPTAILSRWAEGLDAGNVDAPLPDLIYPERSVIADRMRENL